MLRGLVSLLFLFFPFPSLLDSMQSTFTSCRDKFVRPALTKLGVTKCPARNAKLDMSARELIELEGYTCEEHIVRTPDGYFLNLQRIRAKGGVTPRKKPRSRAGEGGGGSGAGTSGAGPGSSDAVPGTSGATFGAGEADAARSPGPVLFMHGLMMNSEVWLLNGKDSLPFLAAEEGHDVWLGNNRGNKYGSRHETLDTRDTKFWNFSLDEFARFDVPAMLDYILGVTGKPKCAYVGFSNGTAQMFASLAIYPELERRVSVFVALSPAFTIQWMTNRYFSFSPFPLPPPPLLLFICLHAKGKQAS